MIVMKSMLLFLVFLIVLMLVFKFYRKLTVIVALIAVFVGIIIGVVILFAAIYYNSHPQNQTLGTSTESSNFTNISPTETKTDCVVDGNDYQMTEAQCHHAEAEALAKLGRQINQEQAQEDQYMNITPYAIPTISY